jgi:hypothetical protein
MPPQPNELRPDLTQFDPYSQQQQQHHHHQQQQYQQGSGLTHSGMSPSGQMHPREYIKAHKTKLEMWDGEAWKQALRLLEALKQAWTERHAALKENATRLQMQMQFGYSDVKNGSSLQAVSFTSAFLKDIACLYLVFHLGSAVGRVLRRFVDAPSLPFIDFIHR